MTEDRLYGRLISEVGIPELFETRERLIDSNKNTRRGIRDDQRKIKDFHARKEAVDSKMKLVNMNEKNIAAIEREIERRKKQIGTPGWH